MAIDTKNIHEELLKNKQIANGGLPEELQEKLHNQFVPKESLDKLKQELDVDKRDIRIFDPHYVIVSVGKGDDKTVMTLQKLYDDYSPDIPSYRVVEIQPIQENIILLLKHHNFYLKHNVFTDMPEVYKNNSYVGTLEKYFVDILDKCTKQGFKIAQYRLEPALVSIAQRNKYNPVKDFIMDCYCRYKDDTHDHIGDLLNTLGSTINETDKRLYVTKFLVQMATMGLCEDIDKTAAQFVLVLQSKQGLGKTSWFRSLIPDELNKHTNYFLEGRAMDLNNKDHVLEQARSWLVEMGEIAATFKKSDQEIIKAYITAAFDRIRPPYGKIAIDKKRRMVLCGTTNDIEFLRDPTGDRRFMVIPCNRIDFKHKVDLVGLWAQVYRLMLEDYKYYLSHDEINRVLNNNAEYRVKSDLHIALEELFILDPEEWVGLEDFSSSQILECMRDKGLLFTVKATPKSITQTLELAGMKHRKHNNKKIFSLVRNL